MGQSEYMDFGELDDTQNDCDLGQSFLECVCNATYTQYRDIFRGDIHEADPEVS